MLRSLLSELQMNPKEWTDLIPVVQSALNNALSPQRKNTAPITAFTGLDATPTISTFFRTMTTTTVEINEAARERMTNIDNLRKKMDELHPIIDEAVINSRSRQREKMSKGQLPNFSEGDFVLVPREDFAAGEKLSLRWRGPRRIVSCNSEYVFDVEDLRNGNVESVHGTRLKFYADSSLDTDAILSHAVSSETGMAVQRLMELIDDTDGLKVRVRWKGLGESEDSLEPLQHVYEDVPELLKKLLTRKSTPASIADKARRALTL